MPEPSRPVLDPTELTTEALHREISALKDMIEREVGHLKELHGERFIAHDRALDAALAVVKEASAKSDATFSRQIEQLQTSLKSVTDNQNDKINDLRESRKGAAGRTEGVGIAVATVVQAISSVGTLIGVAVLLLRH